VHASGPVVIPDSWIADSVPAVTCEQSTCVYLKRLSLWSTAEHYNGRELQLTAYVLFLGNLCMGYQYGLPRQDQAGYKPRELEVTFSSSLIVA
jgi:hypothetical protein